MRISLSALSCCAVLAAAVPASYGATIVWSAGEDNGFSLENGTNLAAGNLIRLGVFDVSADIIAANAFNIDFLNAHFIEIAAGQIGDGLGGIPEHFNRTDSPVIGSTGFDIAGAKAYMWVFASSDNSTPAASISTVQEHGIFSFSSWIIPSDELSPGSLTIDISDLTNSAGTALLNDPPGPNAKISQVLVGSFDKGVSDTTGAPNFGLQVVPEPASTGLAVVGGMALLLRRRRRA